jgi:hypothetical protein
MISSELERAVSEASRAVDTAAAVAEQIANHRVVECSGFDRLANHLGEAQQALDRATKLLGVSEGGCLEISHLELAAAARRIDAVLKTAANDSGSGRTA